MLDHEQIMGRLINSPTTPERIRRTASVMADSDELRWMRARCKQLQHGGFQVLGGPAGTGKTTLLHYGMAALSLLAGQMRPGEVVRAADLMAMSIEDKERFEDLQHMRWLGVDDLGAEFESSKSDWSAAVWDRVIDSLYMRCAVVLISTNLTAKSVSEKYGERVASRMAEQGEGWYRTCKRDWRADAQQGSRLWSPEVVPAVTDAAEPEMDEETKAISERAQEIQKLQGCGAARAIKLAMEEIAPVQPANDPEVLDLTWTESTAFASLDAQEGQGDAKEEVGE